MIFERLLTSPSYLNGKVKLSKRIELTDVMMIADQERQPSYSDD